MFRLRNNFNQPFLGWEQAKGMIWANFEELERALTLGTTEVSYGNVYANSLTFTTKSTQDVTAAGGIVFTGSYVAVQGDGGAINITANPQISGGVLGKFLVVEGKSDTNTLTLDDGDGLQLSGGMSFTMGAGDSILFVYNGTVWIELSRSNN